MTKNFHQVSTSFETYLYGTLEIRYHTPALLLEKYRGEQVAYEPVRALHRYYLDYKSTRFMLRLPIWDKIVEQEDVKV